jgi:hypothetical protein
MEHMHWMFVGIALLGMPAGWFLFAPLSRDWKSWSKQMADQIARSAALATACAMTTGVKT